MNWRALWSRKKEVRAVAPLFVCGTIAAQHGFVQFYLLKVFLVDLHAPPNSVVMGVLWATGLQFLISVAFTVFTIGFPQTASHPTLKSRWFLIPLAAVATGSFLLPWHHGLLFFENFAFHFSLSLLLCELSTMAVASIVTDALANLFKSLPDPQRLVLLTEATITLSALTIPLTQVLTHNLTDRDAFHRTTYVIAAIAFGITVLSAFGWPKGEASLLAAMDALSPKRLSVRFRKAVHDQVRIVLPKSARHRPSTTSARTDPERTTSEERPKTAWAVARSPHLLLPLIGRVLRQMRITVDCALLYFVLQLLLVEPDITEGTGPVVPLIYFFCLSLHTILFFFLLPAFKDVGPVVLNHLLALASIVNLTALLIFGRSLTPFFLFCLVMENTLARCSCSTIYGMFEGFLLDSTHRRRQKSTHGSVSLTLTARHLHTFAALVPNAAETLSLALVVLVLRMAGLPAYASLPGTRVDKCDPVPHRNPRMLDELVGRVWRVNDDYVVSARIDSDWLANSSVVEFPLTFVACETLTEVTYLFSICFPLFCAVGEFGIMYLYRKQFRFEDGQIIPL